MYSDRLIDEDCEGCFPMVRCCGYESSKSGVPNGMWFCIQRQVKSDQVHETGVCEQAAEHSSLVRSGF